MHLVLYPPVEPDRHAAIVEAARPLAVVNAADRAAALAAMPDAQAFFGKIDRELLARATALRWIQAPTASLEHYMFVELAEHPCLLTNMRGIYSDVIADHVMGFVICFARNFHRYVRSQLHGRWEPVGGEAARSTFTSGPGTVSAIDLAHRHLADATLGVVGYGSIGREVARRAAAFGMRVLAVDRQSVPPDPPVAAVWPPERLEEMLAASDFVVICAPHTPTTAGMFRRRQLQAMQPTAYLINVGRGAILALEDLCDALEAGEIAGAGLDVYEQEPLPDGHRLWRMENAILTPHIAGVSPQIARRHLEVFLDNLRRHVRGERLANVVDKSAWC
jgi:phosphoglycerate dehydrogenase-like enzyme